MALSLVAAFFLNHFYFGGLNWLRIIVLAAIMLAAAYGAEALRRRRSK
jgi:hypothetical protein